jgi:hypothetical protein
MSCRRLISARPQLPSSRTDHARSTGEVLQVGLGGVARIAVVQSDGIWKDQLTIEDIAENLATIVDIDGANEIAVMHDL